MNDCSGTREFLPAYFDNELDDARRRSLERHLAVCESCRTEVAGYRRDHALLQATVGRPVEVSPHLTQAVLERIRRESIQPSSPRRGFIQSVQERFSRGAASPGSVARRAGFAPGPWAYAGVALAVGLFLLTMRFYSPALGPTDARVASVQGGAFTHTEASVAWVPLKPGAILRAGDSVKTQDMATLVAEWRDGSRIEFDAKGEGKTLHLLPGVELRQGRIRAKVNRQVSKESPFTIRTPQATAQVLGTEFMVEAQPKARRTALLVARGVVHFFNRGGSVMAREWTRTEAVGEKSPTLPATVSPLAPDSMWLMK